MLVRPLLYFSLYIIVTLLISFLGPIEYLEYDKFIVAVYMFSFLFFFAVSYLLGMEYGRRIKPYKLFEDIQGTVFRVLKFSIIVTLFLSAWSFIDYVLKYGFSIKNLGQAYIDQYAGYERNSGRSYSALELLSMFTGVFKQISIVLGVYYYKKLNKRWKILLWFSWGVLVFTSLILTGKQKILGDLIIYFASIFLVVYRSGKAKVRINKKYIWLAVGVVGFLFIYMQKQRYSLAGIDVFNYNEKSTEHVFMNPDHLVFKVFGYEWGFPIAILLTTYLSGGYYGLSLCLKLPFEWTYGLGHSYSLSVIADRFLGLPFYFDNGYVMRMEQQFGWPAMSKWHTIFPYLASDLTFYGAIMFFVVIGIIYAIAYVEVLRYKNPLSLLLFTTLNIMLVFVPANNQLMIGPEGYFGFLIILFVWLLFHKRFNTINQEA